jgi:hypothetical protein
MKEYEQGKQSKTKKIIQKEMGNVLNYVHLVHVVEECLGCEGLPSFLGFALAFLETSTRRTS